eukprot:TRINITY_DN10217_c1_g1_i2.p1 TRINITY_DN10217_c1_g1~~TRINITY_DN10217_c1_g1_i2.p1  ORF type:complete len:832 (-),score=148.59 TRINITY_DN10217_c1_g1_i2:29-2155(-)
MEKGRADCATNDLTIAEGPRKPGLQPAGSCSSNYPRIALGGKQRPAPTKPERGVKTQRVLNLESLLQCDTETVQQQQQQQHQQQQPLLGHLASGGKQFHPLPHLQPQQQHLHQQPYLHLPEAGQRHTQTLVHQHVPLGHEHRPLQHVQSCATQQQHWTYVASQPQTSSQVHAASFRFNAPDEAETSPEGEPSWFDEVGDVEEALQTAWKFLGQMSTSDLVGAVRLVAKLADAEAFGNMAGLSALQGDARLLGLISRIRVNSCQLDSPRNMMRVMWAVGKVGLKNDDVEGIFQSIWRLAPPRLHQFSSQELSNALWGLTRYCEIRPQMNQRNSKQLALLVLAESTPRLAAFSPQCLTNSLWAVAKMELNGGTVDAFGTVCLEHIHKLMFKEISPQGLANSIWACAKLVTHRKANISKDLAMRFCADAARRAMASEDLLKLFFPQELSMAIWGIATLIGRKDKKEPGPREICPEVENFGLAVVTEAMLRIQEFSPQGLSNIAWALATLDLVRHEAITNFFVATAAVAAPDVASYSPQAIANLLWALGRAHSLRKVDAIVIFAKAAALEAQRRARQFAWQDLSGVLSALTNLGLSDEPEIQSFAVFLVCSARECCSGIGTQALLNIAQSAARLRVEPELLKTLAMEIPKVFPERLQGLNSIDMRQWNEVKSYTNLMGEGCNPVDSTSLAPPGRAGRPPDCSRKGWKTAGLQ